MTLGPLLTQMPQPLTPTCRAARTDSGLHPALPGAVQAGAAVAAPGCARVPVRVGGWGPLRAWRPGRKGWHSNILRPQGASRPQPGGPAASAGPHPTSEQPVAICLPVTCGPCSPEATLQGQCPCALIAFSCQRGRCRAPDPVFASSPADTVPSVCGSAQGLCSRPAAPLPCGSHSTTP